MRFFVSSLIVVIPLMLQGSFFQKQPPQTSHKQQTSKESLCHAPLHPTHFELLSEISFKSQPEF
jgi:hypothetical protein